MAKSATIAENLNEFNTLTSQLESVEINFDDEIRPGSIVQSARGLRWSRDGREQFQWNMNLKV